MFKGHLVNESSVESSHKSTVNMIVGKCVSEWLDDKTIILINHKCKFCTSMMKVVKCLISQMFYHIKNY